MFWYILFRCNIGGQDMNRHWADTSVKADLCIRAVKKAIAELDRNQVSWIEHVCGGRGGGGGGGGERGREREREYRHLWTLTLYFSEMTIVLSFVACVFVLCMSAHADVHINSKINEVNQLSYSTLSSYYVI